MVRKKWRSSGSGEWSKAQREDPAGAGGVAWQVACALRADGDGVGWKRLLGMETPLLRRTGIEGVWTSCVNCVVDLRCLLKPAAASDKVEEEELGSSGILGQELGLLKHALSAQKEKPAKPNSFDKRYFF